MQTIQEKIRDRLDLLPEQKLDEVLLFIDTLLNQSKLPKSPTSFGEALNVFREQMAAEDLSAIDPNLFQDVRDRTPAPAEPNW